MHKTFSLHTCVPPSVGGYQVGVVGIFAGTYLAYDSLGVRTSLVGGDLETEERPLRYGGARTYQEK
jgi:hypothetical protein